MADKKRRTTRPVPARSTLPTETLTEASIAARAYDRWINRGCPQTDGQEDWFAARAELLAEHH
ncbi:MAG: DUF2934 domain-containing protein, partial [Polyangiales bacterium]